MIQINIGDHGDPYINYHPVPSNLQPMFQWARQQALWIAANKPGANPYFQNLPFGRSLSDLLADSSIWINYSDISEMDNPRTGGQTDAVGGHEITITSRMTAIGRWAVLGTLIHELAHVDGVPGPQSKDEFGPLDTRAEDALIPCGLGYLREQLTGVDDPSTPYGPKVVG